MKRRSAWEIATGVLLVAFAILSLLTFRSYGVTVDEAVSIENGRYFINWYASGFRDHTIITSGNQRLYGSFFNAISAFLSDRSPLGLYETEHLLIAIFSFLGVLCAYQFGKKLGGPAAGFFSVLLLLLTPVYYGHSFMNPKDIPFAAMFLASVYAMTEAYDRLPRLGVKRIVIVGVAIGLTLAIRVGALMLFGYLVVLAALWLIAQRRKNPAYAGSKLWSDVRSVVVSGVGIGVVAWAVMLIWWPYAQLSPVLNPLRAMRSAANFTDFNNVVLYRG
ncbi:MAG: ArnT family glycosyltransferase, partial [Gemmatimonadaceae bacterium]